MLSAPRVATDVEVTGDCVESSEADDVWMLSKNGIEFAFEASALDERMVVNVDGTKTFCVGVLAGRGEIIEVEIGDCRNIGGSIAEVDTLSVDG